MSTLKITSQNLDEVLNKNDIVFLDFWAAWCGPCRMFGPIFESFAAKHPEAAFGKIDTEAEQQLAADFRIMSIPTLMIFRDNILVFSHSGVVPEAGLEELLTKVKSLDMNQVRKEIDAQEKEQET